MWLGNKQQTECQHPSLVTGFFMGGFVPACHTQTFVEVAKLEFYMTYSLVFLAVICLLFWLKPFMHFNSGHLTEFRLVPLFVNQKFTNSGETQ
jgi:hypothetical protein